MRSSERIATDAHASGDVALLADVAGARQIAFYFTGWYEDYIADRRCMRRRSARSDSDDRRAIRQLETMLPRDGVRILKSICASIAKTQRERIADCEPTSYALARDATRIAGSRSTTNALQDDRAALSEGDGSAACALACGRWHGSDEYALLAAGQFLLRRTASGLAARAAAVPCRTRTSACTRESAACTSPADDPKRVDDEDYERELEALQGRLALLVRTARFRKHALVLAFEGMDAAGKGGAIRR